MKINFRKPLIVTVMLMCASLSAQATIYFVSNYGNDSNDGTSLLHPKATIQAAINAANSGDEVRVQTGEIYLLNSAIVLKEGVSLTGNAILDGQNSTRVIYQAANFSTPTVIEGLVIQNGYLSDKNSYGAGAYLRSNVILRSCVLVNNRIEATTSGSGKGAGLYVEAGSNKIENCSFLNNTISNTSSENTYTAQGAGLYCGNRNTINTCNIRQNRIDNAGKGSSYGGGAYVLSQTVVNNCTIDQNQINKTGSLSESYAQGGGIHLNGSTLQNSSIFENSISYTATESSGSSYASSDNGGGGIFANFSSTILTNAILNNSFRYNVSLPSGSTLNVNHVGGGGILCSGNYATIRNNTVSDNKFTENISGASVSTRNGGGGGMYVTNAGITNIDSCIVVNNAASGAYLGQGGAMCLINAPHAGSITAVNCDIRNNSANSGGGVYAKDVNLISSIIANNTATTNGGGVYLSSINSLINCSIVRNSAATANSGDAIYNANNSTPSLYNTAIWGHSSWLAPSASVMYINASFSAIEGVQLGNNNLNLYSSNSDPQGPNFVQPSAKAGCGSNADSINIMQADWQLKTGSLLVDNGADNPLLPPYDLLHNPRICGNNVVDIGALEYRTPGCTMPSVTPPTYSKITWDNMLTTLSYGNNSPALNASISSGSIAYVSSNDNIAQIVNDRYIRAIGVGVVEILAQEVDNEQNFVQQTLTVTPREITVAAEYTSKSVDTDDPDTLSYTITTGSIANGDRFTGALERTPGDTIGMYNITQGTLTLGPNYDITFIGAPFVIIDERPQGSSVYYVSPNGMDNNTGISWEAAKATIQNAINIAAKENPKASVWVQAGTYNISKPLIMYDGVNVYGGFKGTEDSLGQRQLTVVSDISRTIDTTMVIDTTVFIDYFSRDTVEIIIDTIGMVIDTAWVVVSDTVFTFADSTIINGNRNTLLVNQPYIFTTPTTWNDITFINGYNSNNGGGVVLQRNGALNRCKITDCYSRGAGGGVMCHQGGSISQCHIANNRADKDGGGVFIFGYSIQDKAILNKTTIDNNTAGGNGGGIYASYQSVINECSITNNTANGNGGGIHGSNAAIVKSSIIANNYTPNNGGGAYGNGRLEIYHTALDSNSANMGGGAYLREGSLINSCTINDNSALLYGGGLYFYNGGIVTNSNVHHNSAKENGGGAFFLQNGTLRNDTISSNTALNGGGAYFDNNGNMVNCTVNNNRSDDNGGGMYFNQTGYCDSTDVTNNSAYFGGGIYVRRGGTFNFGSLQYNSADNGGGAYLNAPATINGNLIANNQVSQDGGGIYSLSEGKITLNRIINNLAGGNGGGMYCDRNNSVFINLISNNTAANGGGIYTRGNTNIISCTLVRNKATELGGGIYYLNGSKVANSIVWGNSTQIYINGGSHNITYSAANGNAITGTGNIVLSDDNMMGEKPPQFKHITNFIGAASNANETAQTLVADWSIMQGSVCIDHGSNDAVPQGYKYDIAGHPRIYEDNNIVDLGAYEWVPLGYTGVIKTQSNVEVAHIYPNPTTGEITISTSFEGKNIQVFSLNGSMLYSAPLTSSTVNLNTMPKGTLLIRVNGKEKVAVGKVVKN